MSVIERAEQRLQEEIRQNDLGADNGHLLAYWTAYLDGARAQKKEGGELAMSALNYVERQGFLTGMDYAGMTAEERETLLKELRNLPVGPVAQLPKRGEWIDDTTTYAGPGLSNYKCSLCGKICGTWRRGLKQNELPNWCGNCGADMRAKMEVQDG